jgi:hypothetical protein
MVRRVRKRRRACLRFSIEHGHDNNLTLDLSSVAYKLWGNENKQ